MSGAFISYPISVLWANSIEVARRIGDRDLELELAARFATPFLPGGAKNGKCPDPCHVDLSVFGTVMLEAYLSTGDRKMMSALLGYRRANGMWGQLVDVPRSWDESSATAIFTSAFIRGVRNGWLDAATYGPAARESYLALVSRLDGDANLADVCVGTDIGKTEKHYLDRGKVTGAPHGQAGLLLCVNALLAE